MNFNKRTFLAFVFATITSSFLFTGCEKSGKYEAYLFTYFTGNGPGEESIRFAVSEQR